MSNSRQSILLTGSEGFIGKHLGRRLKSHGYEVVKFSLSLGFDIKDPKELYKIKKIDTVIHLAGLTFVPDSWKNPREFINTNFGGTLNVLEFIREKRVNANLILGSAFIYGNTHELLTKENSAIQPNNPYAVSKYLAEEAAKYYSKLWGISTISLRCFNIYGPGQSQNFLIPQIIAGIKKNKVILDDPKPRRDFIFIDDVVDAYMAALKYKGEFEAVNIASSKTYSVKEIADMLIHISSSTAKLSFKNKIRHREIFDIKSDITKAKKILNWSPKIEIREGLKRTLESELSSEF